MFLKPKTLKADGNFDVDTHSLAFGLYCDPDDTRTHQSFKDECDINVIVERFGLTGELPENVRVPVSGDFTDVVDFQTALNAVRKAQEGFAALPADVRYRFANDPQRLMEFMADDRNLEEARKLGLVNPEPPKPPRTAVEAIDELAAKMSAPTKL